MKVKPKILIADDSVMNQQMLTEILGDSYEYLYADNGLQALEVLNELHRIFDVARLVDPENNHVLTLDGTGRLTEADECCYYFWGRGDCCENCTSRHALDDKSRTGKLEVRDGALFCVVSHYQRFNGRDCVLEIAARMDDERAPESGAGQGLMHFYRDALTQAYSRLYLNSFRANLEHADGVALIDVDRFKQINDTYGHLAGDEALSAIASRILAHIRDNDTLIRYGGDEFLLMIFCAQTNQFLAPYRKRCFQILFALIMVTDIAEWLAVWLGTGPVEWHTLRMAVKFAELTFTPCVPFVCMRAISGAKTAAWKILPVAFNVVLQIVSLFTGWVFAVDAANQYTRGPLYLLYVATFLIEAVLMMVHCVLFSKRYQYANVAFLVLINTLVAVAALGELYLPTLRLDWVCVSYAAIMFYIYYDQLVQQVDPLTSLLNRRSFDCAMHRVRGRVAVIFLWMAIIQGAGHGNIRCAVSLPVKSGAQRRGDMMDAIDVVKGTVDIADKVVDRFPQTAVILKGQCQGIETVVDLVDFLNTIVLNGAAGANVQLAVVIR